MKKENFLFKTTDGTELNVDRYIPDTDSAIKGIIQFHIGMEEYTGRYNELGTFFSENGYVFNTYDFRGHGKTALIAQKKKQGTFGKIADKNGFNITIDDLDEIISDVKNKYPSKKIVLIGYSFGSFICQGYIEKYGLHIDGCILCGTKGPTQFLNFISTIVGKIDCLFGSDKKASFLERLPDKMNAKRIPKELAKKNRLAWMCTNQTVVEEYVNNPLCSNGFVRSFFVDMMGGCFQIHKERNIRKIPKNLPVLFVYGQDDPVGKYGKTIKKLETIYLKNGMTCVDEKVYSNCRHEIFQENCKSQVMTDILNWITSNIENPIKI